MTHHPRASLDEDVVIDVTKAVEAYDRFKISNVSAAAPSGSESGDVAYQFNSAIRNRLVELRAKYRRGETFLGSKQTFSNWRNGRVKGQVRRRRSVLLAVLGLTGVDISASSVLARQPLNLSPLVELGPLASQKLTNDPEEIDDVSYSIILSSLLFKGAQMKVMSSWLRDEPNKNTEVGTVSYGLNEAYVEFDPGVTTAYEVTHRISGNTESVLGRAEGCVVLWSDSDSKWIVQPTEQGIMRVRLSNAVLCKVRGPRGSFVDIVVTAMKDQLDDSFRVRDERTHQSIALQGQKLRRAREKLFSIALGQRSEGPSILAIQRHKIQ